MAEKSGNCLTALEIDFIAYRLEKQVLPRQAEAAYGIGYIHGFSNNRWGDTYSGAKELDDARVPPSIPNLFAYAQGYADGERVE